MQAEDDHDSDGLEGNWRHRETRTHYDGDEPRGFVFDEIAGKLQLCGSGEELKLVRPVGEPTLATCNNILVLQIQGRRIIRQYWLKQKVV
jgi:hypothetical protein